MDRGASHPRESAASPSDRALTASPHDYDSGRNYIGFPPSEPFVVRQPRDFFEIALRVEWVGCALLLWAVAIFHLVQSLGSGPGILALEFYLPMIIFALVASAMTFAAARRFVYWRVDHEGIHQHCAGIWNWDLPWSDIQSRTIGVATGRRLLLFQWVIPIMTGRFQAIELRTLTGRKRKVNRLATNGELLDRILLNYLKPGDEEKVVRQLHEVEKIAQAKHAEQETDDAPYQLVTRESPVVRLWIRDQQIVLPLVCCNCLGPLAGWARGGIEVRLQTIANFFRPTVLAVPLCARCIANLKQRRWGSVVGTVAAGIAAVVGFFFALIGCFDRNALPMLVMGLLLMAPAGVIVWRKRRRPSSEKLARFVRSNRREGWMEVRFGNREYAQLAGQLNQQGAK